MQFCHVHPHPARAEREDLQEKRLRAQKAAEKHAHGILVAGLQAVLGSLQHICARLPVWGRHARAHDTDSKKALCGLHRLAGLLLHLCAYVYVHVDTYVYTHTYMYVIWHERREN